jgi:hypothetical protein
MTEYSPAQLTSLKKLSGDLGVTDLSLDPKATIAAMDKRYSFTSTRVALAALKKAYPACKEFAEESAKRRAQFQAIDQSQTPTQRQAEQYVKWEDVISFRDEHRDELTDVEYLLLCLYTMIEPVRADYTPMKIVARKPKTLEDGMNYLIVRSKSMEFIFHAFKTHGTIGDVQRKIPKPLERVIRQWIETHPGHTYLLQDESGAPWQAQRIGATVRRMFQRHHGLDTGISMLRHSYSTYINRGQLPLAALKKTAGRMMHGVLMNQQYRFLELE